MRKTSLSWSLAPLVCALLLGGCNPLSRQEPVPTPAPVPVGEAAPIPDSASPAAPTSSAAPSTRMDASIYAGSLSVSLNGRKVGDYPSPIKLDVTPYVKAGKNTLTFDWEANTRGTTKIQYALAASPEAYNDIASFNLSTPESKIAGSKSLDFNLPNPDGSLPAAESTTEAAPGGNTAPSENMTSAPADGTSSMPVPDVTIPPSPLQTPASAPAASGVKAIMSVSANDAPIAVTLNGQSVGDFQSYLKLDVGRYLKPGKNVLNVSWTKKTYFDVKIAYFSSDANDYRDVSRTRLYSGDTVKPGSRTISFQIPSS